MVRLVTAVSDRRGGAVCRSLQLLFLGKKELCCGVATIICSNVVKNKFKRFEGALKPPPDDITQEFFVISSSDDVIWRSSGKRRTYIRGR